MLGHLSHGGSDWFRFFEIGAVGRTFSALLFDRNVLLNNNLRQHDRVEAEPNQSAALVGAIWGLFQPPLTQLHPIIVLRFSRSAAAVFTAKLHHHAISLDLRSYLENGAYEKPAEILTRQPLPHWSSMPGYTRFQRS